MEIDRLFQVTVLGNSFTKGHDGRPGRGASTYKGRERDKIRGEQG